MAITVSTSDPAPTLESQAALYRIREVMAQVIKNIKQEKIYIASCLAEGKLVSFSNNILTIGFLKKNIFHKESLEKPQNKKLIEEHIHKALDSKIGVEFIILKEVKSAKKAANCFQHLALSTPNEVYPAALPAGYVK